MSNTYFKIKTINREQTSIDDTVGKEVDTEISLTAFMGRDKLVQLSVRRNTVV